jgi:competence protein ComGC
MKGKLLRIVIYSLIILVLFAIAIPAFVKARSKTAQEACIDNLRIIDAGSEKPQKLKTSDELLSEKLNVCPNTTKSISIILIPSTT